MRLPSEHDWCAVCAIPACRVLRRACWPRSHSASRRAAKRNHVAPVPRIQRQRGDARRVDLSELRRAIRETRKVRIAYSDAEAKRSKRIVWPIAMAYYVDVTVLGAWCELRNDFRHFRVERIIMATILNDLIPVDGRRLTERWFALQRESIAHSHQISS